MLQNLLLTLSFFLLVSCGENNLNKIQNLPIDNSSTKTWKEATDEYKYCTNKKWELKPENPNQPYDVVGVFTCDLSNAAIDAYNEKSLAVIKQENKNNLERYEQKKKLLEKNIEQSRNTFLKQFKSGCKNSCNFFDNKEVDIWALDYAKGANIDENGLIKVVNDSYFNTWGFFQKLADNLYQLEKLKPKKTNPNLLANGDVELSITITSDEDLIKKYGLTKRKSEQLKVNFEDGTSKYLSSFIKTNNNPLDRLHSI